MTRKFSVLIAAVMTLCAAVPALASDAAAPHGGWRTAALSDHPLVGRIWSVAQQAYIDEDAVLAAVRGADFVLLGEKHDNPDHHLLQARVLEQTARPGDTIVFEMLSGDETDALKKVWRGAETDMKALGPALRWEARGWFVWDQYRPVFDAAAAAGAEPAVGDLPRALRRQVSRGFDVLGDGVAARWGLDRALPDADRTVLSNHILDGHCGLLPEQALGPVIKVQRARDAALADAMLQGGGRRFLIAGGGHVRRDYGVPWYLRMRGIAERSIVAITFVEVDDGVAMPLDAVLPTASGGYPADFLWFTPRVDTEDPCAKYADQLKAFQSHGEKKTEE